MRDFLGKITKRDFLGKIGNKDSFPRVGIFIVSSPFMTTIKELAFGLKITYTQWNKDSFPRVGIFIVRKRVIRL